MNLRIGSRGSQLALWQANHIAALLRNQGHTVEIEIIKTTGDRLQEVTFAQVGSKGMFTKEIEEALDAGKIDLSRKGVHRKDRDFAVIWARSYGKGRVLYNGLGHRADVWERPDIQKMWQDMVLWSMGDLPGDASPRPAPAE